MLFKIEYCYGRIFCRFANVKNDLLFGKKNKTIKCINNVTQIQIEKFY